MKDLALMLHEADKLAAKVEDRFVVQTTEVPALQRILQA